MFKLLKTEKFLAEYRQWHDKIIRVQNADAKRDLLALLQNLVEEVKTIDSKHQDLFTTYRIPTNVEENKNKIVDIRKKIKKKLIECERLGLIK